MHFFFNHNFKLKNKKEQLIGGHSVPGVNQLTDFSGQFLSQRSG